MIRQLSLERLQYLFININFKQEVDFVTNHGEPLNSSFMDQGLQTPPY